MADDGPQPRIKYKKVEKRRNGADQFHEEHWKDYSCNDRENNAVKRVRQHNKAFPKLIDELKKRKSITTITTIRLQDISSDFRTNCSACTKLITLNELQKLNVKPRCLSKKPGLQEGDAAKTPPDNEDKRPLKKQSRHSDRQKLKGIKKMKERSKLALNIKKIANRSCQCVIDDKHNETPATLRAIKSSLGTNVQNVVCEEMDSKPHNEEQPATKTSIQQNSKKNSKQDLKSRNPSNSSYNSYLSMDHEPMD